LATDAHPSPVASAAAEEPAPETTGAIRSSEQPVGGGSAGWTAVGGSPVVLVQGDTLGSISKRYGVPTAALLNANGLTGASQIHGGMRIVIPVYHADAKTAAETKAAEPKVADIAKDKKASKLASEKVAAADDATDHKKAKTDKAKEKELAKADALEPDAKPKKTAKDKVADSGAVVKPSKGEASAAKPATGTTTIAKADLPPPAAGAPKKPAVDTTATGNLHVGGPAEPVTSAQADASGSTPEFRWPARGRIILGFAAGANDGINISLPEGTSVRAAESGVVAYAGDGLKGYGNLILIRHPNGYVTAYANNGELDVKNGETVKRGQIIAKSGETGNVNAPQLHFELRKGKTPVDPTSYLAGL
jgi:murein DD-endopeptidase MepM/ murein hydrolase activator NlpD